MNTFYIFCHFDRNPSLTLHCTALLEERVICCMLVFLEFQEINGNYCPFCWSFNEIHKSIAVNLIYWTFLSTDLAYVSCFHSPTQHSRRQKKMTPMPYHFDPVRTRSKWSSICYFVLIRVLYCTYLKSDRSSNQRHKIKTEHLFSRLEWAFLLNILPFSS